MVTEKKSILNNNFEDEFESINIENFLKRVKRYKSLFIGITSSITFLGLLLIVSQKEYGKVILNSS